MATTYVQIASVSVGIGGAATMGFSSIPATYTDLCLKISARTSNVASDSANITLLTFNGSSSNQTSKNLAAYGTTVFSDNATNINAGALNGTLGTASTFNNVEVYIPNYAGSLNKSLSLDKVNESNTASGNGMALTASIWSQTAAINQITLAPDSGNFAQYSTATLYGISKS